jgi:hypothetical protein
MAKGISSTPKLPLQPSIVPWALLYSVGIVVGVVVQMWLSRQASSGLDRWLVAIWAILCALLGVIHFALVVHEFSSELSRARMIRRLKRSANGHKYKIPQISLRMRVESFIGYLVFCTTGVLLLVPVCLLFTR